MKILDKARLRWGCRRGMLELDLILLPFFEATFDSLSHEEQLEFQELLSEPDQDIYAWILGYQECPRTYLHNIILQIQSFANLTKPSHDH